MSGSVRTCYVPKCGKTRAGFQVLPKGVIMRDITNIPSKLTASSDRVDVLSTSKDTNASAAMSSVPINELPTEILQKTLSYLPPLDLIRCRRVCSRWRDVVDSVVNEEFWRQLCRQDFPDIYKDARLKCDPGLSWHELYKSLRLWGKLDLVDEENWIPICSYPEEDFGALLVSAIEGKVCVHEIYKIVYYDKGEKVKEFNTEWEQLFFRETESTIAYDLNVGPRRAGPIAELVIVKKINGDPDLSSKVVIGDVIDFTVVGEDVYYKKNIPFNGYGRGEYCCQILVSKPEDNYQGAVVRNFKSDIIAMGCKNDILYVIPYTYDVFALKKDNFVFQEYVGRKSSRYILHKFNILYADELQHGLSDEVGFRVSAYYFYMDMTFIGGGDGILRLYNTEQFLHNPRIEPLRQFDMAIRLKPAKQFNRKITGVDVIEKKNGHIVLVAIRKGVFAIELTHSSNRRSARIKKQNSRNSKKIKLCG